MTTTTAMEIRAPADQTEGTRSQVLRWLKTVGETVAENEPLIEIETDKVTVEVASPGSGILREIVKGEQEEINPGDLLGRIETSRSTAAERDDLETESLDGNAARASDAAHAPSASGEAAASSMIGSTNSATKSARPTRSGTSSHDMPRHDSPGQPANANTAARLSPAVRRLLSENSLEPSAVRGTGEGGRLTVEDVMSAISANRSGQAAAASGSKSAAQSSSHMGAQPAPAPGPAVSSVAANSELVGNSHRVPHSAVRKRVAEHMVQSLLHTAPHVTTVFEADMTAVLAHRLRHREDFEARGAPLTLTAYFLQAAVDALRAVPEANSRWTDSALEIFDSMHIGVATALEEGGLVVPVLRDVQSRDLFATAQGLSDVVTRAREGRLAPADVRGGTFTISNHGVSGSLVATPIIINQPQSAILGIGKLEKRPVVVADRGEERIVIRPRCYVTLTIDHRVMDGHQANRFLRTFVERLTNWPV
jgi:2-oxoglutarate dehydrogenase E2 component (dihydrolipoamide succinyltransferase)